jgi:hypothetical protein
VKLERQEGGRGASVAGRSSEASVSRDAPLPRRSHLGVEPRRASDPERSERVDGVAAHRQSPPVCGSGRSAACRPDRSFSGQDRMGRDDPGRRGTGASVSTRAADAATLRRLTGSGARCAADQGEPRGAAGVGRGGARVARPRVRRAGYRARGLRSHLSPPAVRRAGPTATEAVATRATRPTSPSTSLVDTDQCNTNLRLASTN